jgi:hypothetical protein
MLARTQIEKLKDKLNKPIMDLKNGTERIDRRVVLISNDRRS